MDKKYTGIIILLSGILALLIFVFLFFKFGWFNSVTKILPNNKENITENKTPENTQPTKEVKTISGQIENTEPVENTVAPRQINKDDLMRIASSFAERFGSYSNQSNFSNVTDLKMFMTANMSLWADKYVADQRSKNIDTSIYYGITTRSVSQELVDYDDDLGVATILVKTRRREAITSTGNTTNVFDQNITVKFLKENNAWKVDSANWQGK